MILLLGALLGLLQVAFFGLKLGGCIRWPWLTVLLPVAGQIALFGLAYLATKEG